ncbi:MAG: protein phosphatase CheZ [Alphaproteobacteria bacterium]
MSEASAQKVEKEGDSKRERIANIISSVLEKVEKNEQVSLKSILTELHELLVVIEETRKELGSFRPSDIKGKHINSATDELDAIIGATSEATGKIMDSCDVIQDKAATVEGEASDAIVAEVMNIYEACSFQDITGQRVTKVVETFQIIEDKIDKLVSALGLRMTEEGDDEGDGRTGDEALLNGPQLPDNGVSQDDIDKLLAELDAAS